MRRALEQVSGAPSTDILRIEVLTDASSEPQEELLSMHGEVELSEGALVFEPTFPFAAGVEYRATFDGAAFAERYGGSAVPNAELDFRLPNGQPAERPRVVALYPSGEVLPENLLRMYLHFSEPMRQGVAWDHLRLEDDEGREIELGLLELDHELWDPSGSRLTMLFDPGRLKSGLVPNREEGRPFDDRNGVVVIVDGSWRSAGGQALGVEHRARYVVGPPDHDQPRPARWSLRLPAAGSLDPLRIELDGPLDHGMLQGSIAVRHETGAVATRVEVDPGEVAIKLVPDEPWPAGSYRLEVNPRLEDPSGNSVRRPFETKLRAAVGERPVVIFELSSEGP